MDRTNFKRFGKKFKVLEAPRLAAVAKIVRLHEPSLSYFLAFPESLKMTQE